ncbi:hypothetical protein ACIBKY_10900 [Nonomuraea sp. NPDC050394]|uniref:hypothetical protein n=1 Tax=Nonomuraea sp. NPDC050394 TaxID=3364363 RepID=UPI00378D2A5B
MQRESHGDPTAPGRNAALSLTAEASPEARRLKALLPGLRSLTPDQIFDAEPDMMIGAIREATHPK